MSAWTGYGKAERIWVMDRGIPTEEVLEEMRQSDPPIYYLAGTPKGRLVRIEVPQEKGALRFCLRKDKLRNIRRREGRYLLRTNLVGREPAQLWAFYIQLVHVEEAFRNLKGALALRPIHHQKEKRIEAHIFVAFMAYAMHVTLRRRLRDLAPGLTPRSVLEKFAAAESGALKRRIRAYQGADQTPLSVRAPGGAHRFFQFHQRQPCADCFRAPRKQLGTMALFAIL